MVLVQWDLRHCPQEVEVLPPQHWDPHLPPPALPLVPVYRPRAGTAGLGSYLPAAVVRERHCFPFPGLPDIRAQETSGLGTGHRYHRHLSGDGSCHLRNQELAQGLGVG